MLAIASDHAGFELKQALFQHLIDKGYEVEDLGCHSTEPVDYPVYAMKACKGVVEKRYERAILVCGTGLGMSMVANKVPGIRAALCNDCYCVEMTRRHNDANVLCLGGRVLGNELAKRIVDIYMETEFSTGENHIRRLLMMKDLEEHGIPS